MANPKVLMLYMTMPDMMRSGHRMEVEDFECDPDGIMGDVNYEKGNDLLMVAKETYEIIEAADLVVDQGLLMENILVDDGSIYNLKKGTVIEIGDVMFEVKGACEAYGYLYHLAPELPELIQGKRGIFISPIEHGEVAIGNEVVVIQD